LTVPSILDFLSDDGRVVEIELEAELVADDDGVTNLERALARDVETDTDPDSTDGAGVSTDADDLTWIDTLDLALFVRARRVSWSDADTRALGQSFELRDLELTLHTTPDAKKTLELEAVLQGPTPGKLALSLTHQGPMQDLYELGGLELDIQAQGLSVAMLDGLVAMRGELVEVLGSSIDVSIHIADPLGESGSVAIRIDGEERHLHLEGAMQDGAFRIEDDKPMSGALGAPLELVAELLGSVLPNDAELIPGDRHGPMRFDVHQLVLPESSIDGFREGDWLGALRTVRGHFVVELPFAFYYTDPRTQASGVILGLNSGHMEMRTDGDDTPMEGSLFVAIDSGTEGDVELSFKLGRPNTNEPDVGYFDLQVRGISSTAVDGYAELDGCFFEAIGPSFGFRIEGDGLTRDSGELMAFIRSPGLTGNIHGHVEEESLILEPEHGLNATFRPGPGWFERCITRQVGGGWSLNLLLGQDEGLRFLTDGTEFPLPAEWTGESMIAALLESWGKTSFKLGTWRFARTSAGGEEQIVGFEDAQLSAMMDEEGTLELTIESGLYTGEAGTFRLHTVIPDAPGVLSGGDASGVELSIEASGVSDTLLRGVLEPLLPEGVTLSIDAQESVELQWENGGLRRDALDLLDGLSGDVKLALGGVHYTTDGVDIGLSGLTAKARLAQLGETDVRVSLGATVQDGPLKNVLGDRMTVEATLLGPGAATGAGAVEVDLTTPLLTGRVVGRFEGGGFTTPPDERIELAWRPTEAALRELLGASLAPGQSLKPVSADPFKLTVANLRVASDPRAEVELALPTLVFHDPQTDTSISVTGLGGTANIRPGEPPTLQIDGQVSRPDAEPAPLRATVRALTELGSDAEPSFELDVSGTGLPTPLVDALARANGLLVDIFGPRLDLVAHSPGIGPRNGSFHAELVSKKASTTVDGELKDGVLTTAVDQGLDASLGLTPLFSERVVGPLLPLVVDVEKPEGADPCSFRVHELAYPLDGDLSRLDATVELELGEVVYRLLPGLEGSFKGDASKGRRRDVRPLTVRIVQGTAHYDGLPIDIDGHDIGFRGSFGLTDQRLALSADVPLAALGRDFAQKLERYGGDQLAIPVRVRGTSLRPQLDVEWEGLIQSAAGSLLERWIRDR
jgi:hypothetical protein